MANTTVSADLAPGAAPKAPVDPQSRRRPWRLSGRKFGPFDAVAVIVVVAMALLIAYPLLRAVIRILWVNGSFNSEAFHRVFTSSLFWEAAWTTARLLVIAVPIAIGVSALFAWLTERTNARMGVVSTILPVIPLLIPGLAVCIGWKFLADERAGFLNVLILRPLLGVFGYHSETGPLNINSWPGLIFVYTVELIPFAYLMISVALRDIDSSYEEASRTTGAGPVRTLWKISLPLIKPALLGATLLCFMIGAAIFSIPVILGTPAGISTLSVYVIDSTRSVYPPQLDVTVVGALFLACFVGILWYLDRRVARKARFARIGGKSSSRSIVDLGGWRYVARVFMITFMLVASVLPLIGLLYVALQPFWRPVFSLAFTMDQFKSVFEESRLPLAMQTSLSLALIGATVGVLIAAVASAFMDRHRKFAPAVDGILKSPGPITHVAIGVGFIIGLGAAPISLAGTWWILFLCYLVLYSPNALIAVGAAYGRVGGELSEASAVSGASPGRSFRKVSLPLMVPGLSAAWVLLFAHMLGEATASSLLSSPNHPVAGFIMIDIFESGFYGQLAAFAVLVGVINFVVAGTVLVIGQSRGATGRLNKRQRWWRRLFRSKSGLRDLEQSGFAASGVDARPGSA
ncbi:iron ABC transporter permease [Intrasporangium mesophilum]